MPDALLLLPIFGRFGGLPWGEGFGPEKEEALGSPSQTLGGLGPEAARSQVLAQVLSGFPTGSRLLPLVVILPPAL